MTTTLRRIPPLERAGAFVEGIGHAVSFRLQDAYAVFAFHRRPYLLRRANERNFRRFDASWRACKGVPVQGGEPRAFPQRQASPPCAPAERTGAVDGYLAETTRRPGSCGIKAGRKTSTTARKRAPEIPGPFCLKTTGFGGKPCFPKKFQQKPQKMQSCYPHFAFTHRVYVLCYKI